MSPFALTLVRAPVRSVLPSSGVAGAQGVLALHGSPLLARSGFLENGGAVLVSACL